MITSIISFVWFCNVMRPGCLVVDGSFFFQPDGHLVIVFNFDHWFQRRYFKFLTKVHKGDVPATWLPFFHGSILFKRFCIKSCSGHSFQIILNSVLWFQRRFKSC